LKRALELALAEPFVAAPLPKTAEPAPAEQGAAPTGPGSLVELKTTPAPVSYPRRIAPTLLGSRTAPTYSREASAPADRPAPPRAATPPRVSRSGATPPPVSRSGATPPPREPGPRDASGYLAHFGLNAPPFSDIRQPHLFWRGGPFARVLDALAADLINPYHIQSHGSPLVLVGAPGSGKTFCVEALKQRISGLQYYSIEPALLFTVTLMQELCRRLGLMAPDAAPRDLMPFFVDAALARERGTSRLLVVLDDFVPGDPALLDELKEIAAAAPDVVRLLLVGAPDLPAQLAAAGAAELLSPEEPPVGLAPMGLPDVAAYLEHRLRAASDGSLRVELPPAACQFLHARSGGSPRLINIYCHNALVIAFLRQSHRLTVDVLRLAMKSESYLTPAAATQLLAADAAG
jgi:type II secretory pathway predicted ATPase ExeA